MAVTGQGTFSAIHNEWVWPILSVGVIFLTLSIGAISIMCYDAFKICRKMKFPLLRSAIKRATTRGVTEEQPGTRKGPVSEKKTEIPIFTVAEIVSNDDGSNDYNILQDDCQTSGPTISRRPSRLSSLACDIWSVSVHQMDTKTREGWQHLINIDLTDSEKNDHCSNSVTGSVSSASDLPCFDPSTLLDDSPPNKVMSSSDTLKVNHSIADTETSSVYTIYNQATTNTPSEQSNSTSSFTSIATTLSDSDEILTRDRKTNSNNTLKKTQWPILDIPTHSPVLRAIFSRAGVASKSCKLQHQLELVPMQGDLSSPIHTVLRGPSNSSLVLGTGTGNIDHNSNWTKRPLGVMKVEDSLSSSSNPKICLYSNEM